MNRISILSMLIVTILFMSCNTKTEPADLVLKGGTIYTVDNKNPNAEAIAVKDGKITFVGSNKDVEKFIGKQTKVQDLGGKFVLPGFIDTHAHFAFGANVASAVKLNQEDSPEQWVAQIKQFADEHPDANGIFGLGIMPLKFGKNGPTKEMLDKVIPNRPAIIIDEGGHSAWFNSKAYEMAGITKDTPDPVPGVHMYKRKANGEPSGWNLEAMTIYPVIRDLKMVTPTMVKQGTEMLFPTLSSLGLTTYYDAGMMQMESLTYPALQELEKEGKLPVKIVGSYMVQSPSQIPDAIKNIKELKEKYSSNLIRPNTIKIHNDGTIEAETASLVEDYSDSKNNKGGILLQGDVLKNFVADIAKNNLNVHIHAIGDNTISEALDAIEFARKEAPNTKSRFSVAHAILIQDKDVSRFGKLDVVVQTTPVWMASEDVVNPALGKERSNKRYLIKSMENAGAKITFGSDFPVGGQYGIFPFRNIEVGMTRKGFDEKSTVLPPQNEKMTLESMIKGYTM